MYRQNTFWKTHMIDAIDEQILTILQENARTPNAEIARHIGMTASAIFERIKKLEKQGIIKSYEVRLCPDRIGLPLLAFVLISLNEISKMHMTGKQIAEIPGVQEVHYIAGKGSILAKIRTAGTLDLERRLDQINQIKNVSVTETTIVLKTDLESMSLPISREKN